MQSLRRFQSAVAWSVGVSDGAAQGFHESRAQEVSSHDMRSGLFLARRRNNARALNPKNVRFEPLHREHKTLRPKPGFLNPKPRTKSNTT